MVTTKQLEETSHSKPNVKKMACRKCGKVKEIDEFYSNRFWKENNCRDSWCKDCFGRIDTKEGIKEYYWENRRKWHEEIWENAERKAASLLAGNETYERLSEEKQESIFEKTACKTLGKTINSVSEGFYEFYDPTEDGKYFSYADYIAKTATLSQKREIDSNAKQYSEEFNGYFKPSELEYLESYYARLEDDFNFDTENRRDYARKVCKASLQADKAQDDYMAGRCDYSVVKDAMALFDTLSKSANFAACKRKEGDSSSLGSWSELTYMLETSGHPCIRKIEWEEDDVDRTYKEFMHTVSAIAIDNG